MKASARPSVCRLALGMVMVITVPACQRGLPSGQSLVATGDAKWSKLSDSQTADVKVAEGRSFEDRGQIEKATAAYEEAIKADTHRADAYLRLARIRDSQGKFRESQDLYEKALQAAPGSADICCDMGYSLYLQRRWREAEVSLRQAIALQPDHRRAHTNLALVMAHQGRDQDALAEFRLAGCSAADAHANLGFVRMVQGSWSAAEDQYRRALVADPKSKAAAKGLAELTTVARKMGTHTESPALAQTTSSVWLQPPRPVYAPASASSAGTTGSPYAARPAPVEAAPGPWLQSASARPVQPEGQQ